VRFPGTFLATVLFPLWAFKLALLYGRRWRVARSSLDRWFDEVDPSLVVGGALFPGDLERLCAAGVGAILNLCAEYLDDVEACAGAGVATAHVPVHDDLWVRAEQFEKALAWIDARVGEGRKVYVHCAAGRGRSVSIAIAWLCRRRALTVDDALARIRSVRRAANPTPWQMRAVRRIVAAAS
jgi:atypical dual specificity phosphatase